MSPVRRGMVVGGNLVGSPFDWKRKVGLLSALIRNNAAIFHPQIICNRVIKFLQQKLWSNCN